MGPIRAFSQIGQLARMEELGAFRAEDPEYAPLTPELIGLGFDPELVMIHTVDPERVPLTFDLIERYRQRYVDVPLLKYALRRSPWRWDESGFIERAARCEIAQVVLEALNPNKSKGLPAIRRDLESLRLALLSGSSWRPPRPRRWSYPR